MRRVAMILMCVGVFSYAPLAYAEMTSSNFIIRWDSVNSGGLDSSSSATYLLRDTAGEAGIGLSSSSTYQLGAGYRQGVNDQVITFDVFAQTNASGRAATASAGTTITCSTAGLSVDDFIVLVQDDGVSQVSAIGQIISIGVGTITVDELRDGGTAPVIDGTNDFVYRLASSSAELDALSTTAVNTAVVGFNVMAEVDGGYTVQIADDGNLRDGASDINDFSDGAVSVGAEEYGGLSSDASLTGSTFDTADTAFTTSFQEIASRSTASFESRDFVTLKASISGSTSNGSYAHTLSVIVSGNY